MLNVEIIKTKIAKNINKVVFNRFLINSFLKENSSINKKTTKATKEPRLK